MVLTRKGMNCETLKLVHVVTTYHSHYIVYAALVTAVAFTGCYAWSVILLAAEGRHAHCND